MSWKSELLALVFGMLTILIIFGDGLPGQGVGNLDTVFGQAYWPLMDVVYPLASIIVFLLYGRVKGSIHIHISTTLLFVAFLAGILIMQFDDLFVVIGHPIKLSWTYWAVARWSYLVISTSTFITYGWVCHKMKKQQAVPNLPK